MFRDRYLPLLVSAILLISLPIIFREPATSQVSGEALRLLVEELETLRSEWSRVGISIPFLRLLGPDSTPEHR